MAQKTEKRRAHIEITAYWGNDDAESTIKVSRRRWKEIQEGAEYATTAWGWYEGSRFSVAWSFAGGEVSIDGDDGMQCVVDLPICELIAQTSPPGEVGPR
jgi:hypothetical protein